MRSNGFRFSELVDKYEQYEHYLSQSYLLLPMQRVTRMPLLLSAIFKKTDDNSPGIYKSINLIVNAAVMFIY